MVRRAVCFRADALSSRRFRLEAGLTLITDDVVILQQIDLVGVDVPCEGSDLLRRIGSVQEMAEARKKARQVEMVESGLICQTA